jgi:uncharacterized protein (TIGR00645 family)
MERILENLIFKSRWLLAPFYLGLCVALLILLGVFINEFLHFFSGEISFDETSVILLILTLIDLSFAGNLLIIVIFSGRLILMIMKIDQIGWEQLILVA